MEEENDLKFHHAKFEADKLKVFKLLFLLRSSKNSESPRYSLVESVFCCWGSTGSTGDGFPFTHSLVKQKYLQVLNIPSKANTA